MALSLLNGDKIRQNNKFTVKQGTYKIIKNLSDAIMDHSPI